MKNIKLNNGTEIPELGLGLWQMKDEAECKQAVDAALKAGYRHFDTAQSYGNEAFLGKALAESGVPREELFITTKVAAAKENMHWQSLIPLFEESLAKLQTDYVDLLLIHFPLTEWRRPAWRRLEEIAASGKAKAIGVSNYTVRHLEILLAECDIKPAVNQFELHVYLQQPKLLEFCKADDILVEAYSPMAHGYGMDNPELARIAAKHNKTVAQVMIRWCIEVGTVPLPKSVNPARIQENIDVFDFALDQDDLEALKKLDRNYHTAWDPTDVA